MKKIFFSAALAAALVVAPAAVDAKKPDNPPAKSKRCKTVNRGFSVSGTNAVFTVTQNPDGTYDGSVTLKATKANKHARKSGVNAKDDTPETFQLDDTKIKGKDPATTQPDDTVKLTGKIKYAKKGSKKHPCGDQGFGSDRYGDPTIRKAHIRD